MALKTLKKQTYGAKITILQAKNLFHNKMLQKVPGSFLKCPHLSVSVPTRTSRWSDSPPDPYGHFRNRIKSLIDENNKLKYEIENLQRAAKLFSEEVQNELRNDFKTMLLSDLPSNQKSYM